MEKCGNKKNDGKSFPQTPLVKQTEIKIKHTTMAYQNCNKASISITRVKSTKIGLKETERNKA